MRDLDDPLSYEVDASGMFRHIERLGSEFGRAWEASAAMETPTGSFDNIVISAMGGSAAAADYFAALASRDSLMPLRVVRGYGLPGYVNARSLVVALSYSGGTEEVLACYAEASLRGAATLAISCGGELLAAADAAGAPSHRVTYDSPPRAALPHLLAPLLRMGQRLGMLTVCDDDIAVAANAHEQLVANHVGQDVPAGTNAAKQLAELLLDANPLLILGAEHLAAAGRRTRNQMAENAKALATFEEFPEGSHNVIEALRPREGLHPIGVLFDSANLHPANHRRFELAASRFDDAGGAMAGLQMRGLSRLADMMEATAWGDYLSCYLAVLRGVDPTPTPELERVRAAMTHEAIEAP